jgi:hypothetical protein
MARLMRWVPVLAVAALVGAAMLAAVYSNPRIARVPLDRGGIADAPAETPRHAAAESALPTTSALPQANRELPGWIFGLLSGLCAAAIVIVLLSLLWVMLRDRLLHRRGTLVGDPGRAPTLAQTQSQVRVAVEEGLADLDVADQDPRRAIIACWLRLEGAATAAGTPRRIGDTSTDLVRRLLSTHAVSAEALDGLASVYREARFAAHPIGADLRDQARAALHQLRHELTVGAR